MGYRDIWSFFGHHQKRIAFVFFLLVSSNIYGYKCWCILLTFFNVQWFWWTQVWPCNLLMISLIAVNFHQVWGLPFKTSRAETISWLINKLINRKVINKNELLCQNFTELRLLWCDCMMLLFVIFDNKLDSLRFWAVD